MVGALRRPGHLRPGRRRGADQGRDAAAQRAGQHARAGEAVGAAGVAHASAAKPKRGAKVTLRRAGEVKGKLVAWACPATISAGATPPPCSAKVTLRKTATLRLPASTAGKVRVVVIRARR